jgi:hypothetical protein
MPDCCRHPPDLTVFPFGESNLKPSVRNLLTNPYRGIPRWNLRPGVKYGCLAGTAAITPDDNRAAAECGKRLRIRDTLHLNMVCSGMCVVGGKKFPVHSGLVGKQEQAFGVHIQPAHGIHTLGETEFSEGSLTRLVGSELGEDAIWLVECDDQWDVLSEKRLHHTYGGAR